MSLNATALEAEIIGNLKRGLLDEAFQLLPLLVVGLDIDSDPGERIWRIFQQEGREDALKAWVLNLIPTFSEPPSLDDIVAVPFNLRLVDCVVDFGRILLEIGDKTSESRILGLFRKMWDYHLQWHLIAGANGLADDMMGWSDPATHATVILWRFVQVEPEQIAETLKEVNTLSEESYPRAMRDYFYYIVLVHVAQQCKSRFEEDGVAWYKLLVNILVTAAGWIEEHPLLSEYCLQVLREQSGEAWEQIAEVARRFPRGDLGTDAIEMLQMVANGVFFQAEADEPNPHVSTPTTNEAFLSGIWEEVLGLRLQATEVVARIRSAFGVEVPLQSLITAPTVTQLALAIEEACTRRHGLALPPITRVPGEGSFPLSPPQERMWFLQELFPASSQYNLAQFVRLRGTLDIVALACSITELVHRHEPLRTVFRIEDGNPVQVVQPPAPMPLPVVDLSALSLSTRGAEARLLAIYYWAMPFDLTYGPLFRTLLLRLAEDEYSLLLVIHHIISDTWSFGIIVHDVVALYRAFVAGKPSPLPELEVQYRDFVTWQRQMLSGELLEIQTAYWRRRLEGAPPPLQLPTDFQRARVHAFQPGWEELHLPAELIEGLHALARRQGASFYITLLAAWKVLLARIAKEEDILIGAPIANRNHVELQGLIGFFVNTLMLRTDLSDNPGFEEILARVRDTALGAFTHQDLPLEMVLQAWYPERTSGPSFQVLFVFQNLPPRKLTVPGLTVSQTEADFFVDAVGTYTFEAGLTVLERPQVEGLEAFITYNTLLFDRTSMTRLLERYKRLLIAAVGDPGYRLWDLDLLEETERAELIALSGPPLGSAARFVPVHRVFAARVEATPEAIAVMAGKRRLTYRELDRRSNHLAHRLRALGIGPEQVVGVAIERSPELIVAFLAVLKAGGAYVPLDPSYPSERLLYMLDSASALLITSGVLAAVPSLVGTPIPTLLVDEGTSAEESEDEPQVEISAGNLAYLIYTSGSTGRPKGVMVHHDALASYIAAFRDEHRLGSEDRVLQFAAVSFDTSAEEIYSCLTSGAALVLRDDAMLFSVQTFLDSCGALGITVLDLPTAFWHDMVANLTERPSVLPPSLRLIVVGGERVLPERLAAWNRLGYHHIRLINAYGPTETTIVATSCDLAPDLSVSGEVPIGKPVPGAWVYVTDPFLQLAPSGIPGELCIAGVGLARGYLGQPDLTAERFLPDPWAEEPGSRLYHTGDLVRWLPSGNLEFFGRVDDQVKIQGYRVELREIEANLALHPEIAHAVVVAREDAPGNRRLTAYVVPYRPEETPRPAELRAFLREQLPDYMIPVAFVVLDSLPLTPSGKVDRRALPAPESLRPRADIGYTAPRTEVEQIVADLWSEILGLERVSVTDNFFDLGGHSLLVPQVMYRLQIAFQVEVPLRTLFEEPTVERTALAIEKILADEIERQLADAKVSDGEESITR